MADRFPPAQSGSDGATRVLTASALPSRPADRFGDFDGEPFTLSALREARPETLVEQLGVSDEAAALAIRAGQEDWSRDVARIVRDDRDLVGDLTRVHARTHHAGEAPLHVVDVVPDGAVLSGTPFAVDVHYQNAGDAPLAIVAVTVAWAGAPFVVQQDARDSGDGDGRLRVAFGEEHALPVGAAELLVELFRQDGAQSTFRRTVYVLPANPLSLSLGPAGARVTGNWSARGDYQPGSDTFLTECEIVIANGDAGGVSMGRRVDWEFWDGGAGGGTLVESGHFDWPGAISVGGHATWRGTVWFSSPRGSGIFGRYDRKEDMAIVITMRAANGRVIRGEITARVMLTFGVNIIKVGDFGAQEHIDLYDAVDRMRLIYERRDFTLRGVDRRIIGTAQAGNYPIINSEDEFRDLLEDWSCRNDFIDIYVVQDFQWGTFNGYAGNAPGPASKGGREDGVAIEKTGFTDASGTRRLNVTTLAQLIGHEVGHYLGLSHLEDPNNLMRSNTGVRGPDLNYDQYRLMFPHGFMFYE
jgi:hypothetical protein